MRQSLTVTHEEGMHLFHSQVVHHLRLGKRLHRLHNPVGQISRQDMLTDLQFACHNPAPGKGTQPVVRRCAPNKPQRR